MPLTYSDEGAGVDLGIIFNNSLPAGGNNLTLKLFTNDVTPLDTDTAATYTEASGGGYAAKTLTNGSWTIAGDPKTASYAEQTFTFTGALSGGATVYGYYVVDADNKLKWAERLPVAQTPATSGDEIKPTPKFKLSKGTPS
jgi:hypothetical protein